MASQPIRVLFVSEDRPLLRCLGTLLRLCGCEVCQVGAWEQAEAALASVSPDFLILDAQPSLDKALEVSRRESARRALGEVYTLLLTQSLRVDELYKALEAGVDDFLTKPIVYCEILARLRAGMRELEMERRLGEQARVDPCTGLPDRRALESRLKRQRAAGHGKAAAAACVLMEIDFFPSVTNALGRQVGETVLRCAAAKLRELAGESAFLASLGGGRFALVPREMCEEAATVWAKRLRQAWAESEILFGERPLQFTASFGVAGLDADNSIAADEVLRRSAEALDLAKASGGDLVVRYGEFDDQDETWSALAAPGKIFEGAVARDVMTPLADELLAEDLASVAAALLRRSKLAALPAVDDDGKLLGIVTEDCVVNDRSARVAANATVGQVMNREARRLDESASFADLIETFDKEPTAPIVITYDGRATGLVTPESLGLLGRKLSKESLRATGSYSPRSDYLVIPDLDPAETV